MARTVRAIFLILPFVFAAGTASSYFDTSGQNLDQLNILQEYELERYSFPAVIPQSEAEVKPESEPGETILYRISSGPKSPKKAGKTPVYIQHGILCDTNPCTVNKPKIAVAYILVDQGYDVWLGISDTNSTVTEYSIASEENERKHLEHIAQYILASTQSEELMVMGQYNGTVQFFGVTAPSIFQEEKKQSKISRWLEKIPGVRMIKRLFEKGSSMLSSNIS